MWRSRTVEVSLDALIVVLAVHSVFLSGATEGISFYLVPSIEKVKAVGLATFVDIMSGLIIFPACFSYGVQPDAGPSLIFVTLPNVFVNMAGGCIWGALFFMFMTFASFSTVMAVFENLISFAVDMFGTARKKAVLINGAVVLIASIPCVLCYNVWSSLHLIGGRDVLDSEDFIVSNLLLPN